MKSRPRRVRRSPLAAVRRRATQTTTITRAAARCVLACDDACSRSEGAAPAASGRGVRGSSTPGAAPRGQNSARPKIAQQGRQQGHGHEQADQHRERHAGAEVAEEPLGGHGERGRAGRHHEPRGDDQRRVARGGAARGRPAGLAAGQLAAHAREVEDRVVGDDAEEQHDDDRLELRRRRRPDACAEPGHDPQGDLVGEAGREQRDQRREQRAEGQADDQGDEDDRGDLHVRQRGGDAIDRSSRAGIDPVTPTDRGAGVGQVRGRVAVGELPAASATASRGRSTGR